MFRIEKLTTIRKFSGKISTIIKGRTNNKKEIILVKRLTTIASNKNTVRDIASANKVDDEGSGSEFEKKPNQ